MNSNPSFPDMSDITTATRPDLIVSGRIRRHDGSWGPGEVWSTAGVVTAVVDGITNTEATRRIDAGEAFVIPGAVDAHMHCYSFADEGILAATSAAAAGGVTTVVEMPYDAPGPINSVERLVAKQELAHRESVIDMALLGTLAPQGGWKAAEGLASGGVVGFKLSLFHTDTRRFPRINNPEMLNCMAAIAETGRTMCTHAEDNEIIQHLSDTDEALNSLDPHMHCRVRPPVSETLGVLTALELAHDKGVKLHVCHVSLPRSVDLVRWFREQGDDVTTETCPHYLSFTEDDMDEQGTRLKINPPLRTQQDRNGLWNRIAEGTLPVVSSDHAPWPLELKTKTPALANKSGVPSIETLVTMTLGQALTRDPSLTLFGRAVDALTSNPAHRFGIDHRKGSLEPGKDADIIVFAPDPADGPAVAVDGSAMHSNAGWSPYDGLTPGGHVACTISRGEVVWDAATRELAAPGRGELITRGDVDA